jgi:hypothetical protein
MWEAWLVGLRRRRSQIQAIIDMWPPNVNACEGIIGLENGWIGIGKGIGKKGAIMLLAAVHVCLSVHKIQRGGWWGEGGGSTSRISHPVVAVTESNRKRDFQ